ncbi:hypothetical protein KK060_19160 [Fulvivirgaceae bacterium PWU20]|uniref:Uncharacterized protein n=1 Tax=Chryseosolibacter indicus TaxID=2782351 RepID=A0ABS5VVF1_9BACT|nr:hypothetical protein [Chryseosolibacter indicus]
MFSNSDSTKVILTSAEEVPPEVKAEIYRAFQGLDYKDDASVIFDPILLPNVLLADSTLEKRNHAHSLLEEVKNGQRYLETLDALSEIELPVGIVKSGGAVDYSILIDRMTFNTKGAIMEVYVSLELPQTGDRIAFNGKIPLSKEGGISGEAKVLLVGDHHIKFSNSTLLTIKGTNNTYVAFDCNGFKGISIEAEVQFSRELIVPEDAKGNVKQGDERVKVTFTTYAQSLNDLMVGVTIPPFQVNGLKGFGFTVNQAFMDWSDLANPPGISFPPGYTSPFLEAGHSKLWQGFYLQRLEVRLPPSFTKKRSDGSRITIGVEKMILDDLGFTGTVFGEHVLEGGDMSGWGYSLDRVALGFVTNQVQGFELNGTISIPKLKNKQDGSATKLAYVALRSADGNYQFSVTIKNEMKLPFLVADLNLGAGSTVTVKEKDNKFYPSATLNGELTINALSKGPKASFNSIRFEGLTISSEEPNFDIKALGFGKEGQASSVSKFPVAINNIMVRKDANRIGLGFDLTINIGGSAEEGGFGGTAALVVWGKREIIPIVDESGKVIGNDQDDLKFDKVEISGVGVNYKKPGVIEIAGMIRFFDEDPVYGDGFKGSVSGKIQTISLQVEALFGKTSDYRYWYADALIGFENGVPLAPGFSAYGFGGGFYSKMKQSTNSISTLGKSASGITYIPDSNTTGIKAMVKFGATPSQAPYNGDVTLEVMLNRYGGINSVTFTGNVRVMTSPLPGDLTAQIREMVPAAVGDKSLDKFMELIQGQVYGSVKIHFDNINDVFHANSEIYVNVAAGLVRGVSSGNKAGWAVMHFSKDEWYFLVGTPDQPIGLEILRSIKVRSYFMLGKNLPGSPPPPDQVSEILGGRNLDYMRDLNAAEAGLGLAFGLHFGVDTGDLRFLMFYGRFSAGIGTDMMVKKYGREYHCEGSNDPIGINGWFANGQAYAFVQGKIGIKVKLRFYKGNYEILSIGAAAILQAKGPNPFWMKGIVGGYYRILGGLVKGNCKFEVTIGKDCKVVGESNPLEDVNIIAEMSPVKGSGEVDVFNAPQTAFNIPIGEVFDITDIENRKRSFRGKLVEFNVYDGKDPLPGSLRWNDEQDVVAFDSRDVLPPRKELRAFIKITFEEFINGVWKTVVFDGKEVEETSETNFTTGDAPDYIPASNVAVSYPMFGHFNFYPREYDKGFIQLRKGQPYLFTPGADWIQTLHMTNVETQTYTETTLSYNVEDKRVNFIIPSEGLQNEKMYNLIVLNIPRQAGVIDANVQRVETEIKDAGDATLTTKKIEGDLALRDAKTVYAAPFRTSKYNTLGDKVRSISMGSTMRIPTPAGDLVELISYLQGDESFDQYELQRNNEYPAMVQPRAVISENSWYNQYVHPLVYEGYPMLGSIYTSRDTTLLGLPPIRAVFLEQFGNPPIVEEGSSVATASSLTGNIHYDLMRPIYADYRSLQQQVANYVVDKPERLTDRFVSILTKTFPFPKYGKYKVRLNYVIPHINKTTSSHEWELFNAIPD